MESINGSHKAQSKSKSSAADDIPQAVNKNVPNTKAYIKVYTHRREVPELKMVVQLISGHLTNYHNFLTMEMAISTP
jgi:hypothetical protein